MLALVKSIQNLSSLAKNKAKQIITRGGRVHETTEGQPNI